MVMEKANTLDLSFFEDATFYDALQQAQSEAASRPIGMISQTFGLGQTIVTLLSMMFVLTQLAWWMALVALIAPLPAFYRQHALWLVGLSDDAPPVATAPRDELLQQPAHHRYLQQRDQALHAGRFLHPALPHALQSILRPGAQLIVPRYLASFFWGTGSLIVNGLIYLYVASRPSSGGSAWAA